MVRIIMVGLILLLMTSCASYVTPGGHVDLSEVHDTEIKELYEIKPTAKFPSHIAFTRIQQSGYSPYSNHGYGSGRFSVITNREIESDNDIEKLQNLKDVEGIAPLSKVIIPRNLTGLRDIRLAAAKLHADILMVYTFDTTFKVGPKKFQASDVISLGFFKNKEVKVFSTASAAFYDARTGYLYGLAEATEVETGKSNLWGSSGVVDELRKTAEKEAFTSLVPQIEKTWNGIVEKYSN